MQGHQVIEDLTFLLNQKIKDPIYKDGMRVAISGLKNAQHFYLGSYEDLVRPLQAFREKAKEVPLFLGMCSEHIRMPYKSCWFEFEDKSFTPNETIAVPKRGLLVTELQPHLIWVVIINWIQEWRRWTLNPQHYFISVGKTFGEDPVLRKMIAEKILSRGGSVDVVNNYMAGNVYPMSSTLAMTQTASVSMAKDDQRDLFVLNSALMLLNCKNISTEDNSPPDKLNKKRKKNGKTELFTYKTLVLTLPSNRNNKNNSDISTAIKHKIHLCRGHFKLYTEDAPLFGRYKGLYWWDAHLRGDKRQGLLTKDYMIETASQN